MNNFRKYTLSLILAIFSLGYSMGQNKPCSYWYIEPKLYNNYISDSTLAKYWDNYWYHKPKNSTNGIPDILKVELEFTPSSFIIFNNDDLLENSSYRVKSVIIFKYGSYDRSNNIINPKLSNEIVLFDDEIDLKNEYRKFIKTSSMGFTYSSKDIRIKDILKELNIYIEEGTWDIDKLGPPKALNQIIIVSYFIDQNNDVDCSSEFTFFVNGDPNNPNVGKWEF